MIQMWEFIWQPLKNASISNYKPAWTKGKTRYLSRNTEVPRKEVKYILKTPHGNFILFIYIFQNGNFKANKYNSEVQTKTTESVGQPDPCSRPLPPLALLQSLASSSQLTPRVPFSGFIHMQKFSSSRENKKPSPATFSIYHLFLTSFLLPGFSTEYTILVSSWSLSPLTIWFCPNYPTWPSNPAAFLCFTLIWGGGSSLSIADSSFSFISSLLWELDVVEKAPSLLFTNFVDIVDKTIISMTSTEYLL